MHTVLDFRMGDAFDPDDELSLWILTIAVAFNDLVLVHVAAETTTKEWERFYYSRVGIGHLNEIMLYLERSRESHVVTACVASLSPDLQKSYTDLCTAYDANRPIANRLRNEAIFHYPNSRGVRAMRKALRNPELQNARGGATSSSGKVRDSRLHYADEVMAMMVMNACGGDKAVCEGALESLADNVAAFMGFANTVQDEFFSRLAR